MVERREPQINDAVTDSDGESGTIIQISRYFTGAKKGLVRTIAVRVDNGPNMVYNRSHDGYFYRGRNRLSYRRNIG